MRSVQLNPYNYEWIERVLKTIQMADESTTLIPLGQVSQLPVKDVIHKKKCHCKILYVYDLLLFVLCVIHF